MIRYTLRQLEYFEEAAQCQSIAAASQKLNVSQPSISSAIRKLEEQLGVDLLVRHHAHGVSLTRAGARFLKESRKFLRLGRELQWEANTPTSGMSCNLAIGCFATLAPVFMPKLIAQFTRLHPSVVITLEEGTQADLVRLLYSGDIEIALLYDLKLPEDIVVQHLARFAPQALLPATHPLAQNSTVSLLQLSEEPLILLDIPPSYEYFTGLFRNAGLRPKIRYSSHSLETVRGMVGQGLGNSVLVTRPQIDRTYDGEQVVVKPLSDAVVASAVALAHLEQVRPTRIALQFEEFCKKQISSQPQSFPHHLRPMVTA